MGLGRRVRRRARPRRVPRRRRRPRRAARPPAQDQDFVVPGVGFEELRTALAPHGRVEDLEVAGQRVGLRLYPHDRAARALAPPGIEFAPPRAERSTGPGRHDFEIVPDATLPVAADMERRDFTVNAMARSLATDELVDPFGGRVDLEHGILRTVTPDSFAADPLRIVRGLRLVSQLGFDVDDETLAQMREHAAGVRLVSGERIGGGLAADGMGELSKLLLGAHPAKALRLARDTGVLVEMIPEYGPAIGFAQETRYHALPLDEHHFEAVQAAADAGAPLAVRLAVLVHDLGKPVTAWRGDGRARPRGRSAPDLGPRILGRLRYPTALRDHVRRIVRRHMFWIPRRPDALRARRFLARNGTELAFDLVAHRGADVRGKGRPADEELARLARFRDALERERSSPHRLRDLAVGGDDLIALGYAPGPALGRTLARSWARSSATRR